MAKSITIEYKNRTLTIIESSDELKGHCVLDKWGDELYYVFCGFSAQRVAEALAKIEQEEEFLVYMSGE